MTLVAGDTMYLPKGTVHYAESTDEGSLHATIGFVRTGWTWMDLAVNGLYDNDRATEKAFEVAGEVRHHGEGGLGLHDLRLIEAAGQAVGKRGAGAG